MLRTAGSTTANSTTSNEKIVDVFWGPHNGTCNFQNIAAYEKEREIWVHPKETFKWRTVEKKMKEWSQC